MTNGDYLDKLEQEKRQLARDLSLFRKMNENDPGNVYEKAVGHYLDLNRTYNDLLKRLKAGVVDLNEEYK